ncbi:MAG TPA: RNA polymerase sigma factor [Gemmatimonadales bacterium]|nr:RNA polymerase sigma factor [Gemmatimonadales bacterium]
MTAGSLAPATLNVLVENHRRFLQFLERRVGSRDIAEDILQDAFVKTLDRPDILPRDDAVIPWFHRVLRNAIIDHYRRGGAERRALEHVAGTTEVAELPRDDELYRVVCACVSSLVDTLKPEYAAAVRRVDLDGILVVDFAREANITPSNAGVRRHRAHAALRKQLALSCNICAEHGCLDCRCGRPAKQMK